jgi:hypothetical protein
LEEMIWTSGAADFLADFLRVGADFFAAVLRAVLRLALGMATL